ncbi:MAG: Trans-feruloyl-CoA synthase FCS1 [Syntrophus sp. SKADARSKE-3]|nr:Trans-feruloyl-CoA synthase FCS1 [Syntrophus sp. SKADARSKE-3]
MDMAIRTYQDLAKRMNGQGRVLIQRQLQGKVELILGMVRDAQFGPCVMIGLGGIMAEAFQDTAFAMAPLSHGEALQLISRIRGQKLLNGFRGTPAVDRNKLAAMLVSMGEMGLAHERIREIDVNPLIITPQGLVAVDATIVLEG